MYTKIASVIEILIGLAIGGFGGFIFWLSGSISGPTAIFGLIIGVPMMLLGISLIIFGYKKAWLPSVVALVITIALFTMLALGLNSPFCFLGSASGIICLILLILGKIKGRKISISWKKIIIVVLIIAGVVGYYLYRNSQRPVSLPVTFPKIEELVGPEMSEYKIYKHKIYGYDMISSETPILEVIVFDDQNENGIMDSNETGLENIHLDEYRNDEILEKHKYTLIPF